MMLADNDRLEKLRLAVEAKYKQGIRKDEPIAQMVADHYGLDMEDLVSRDRPNDIYWARSVAYYLMQKKGNASLRKIAKKMGGECSSKVHYGIKRVLDKMAKDPAIAAEIKALEAKTRGV